MNSPLKPGLVFAVTILAGCARSPGPSPRGGTRDRKAWESAARALAQRIRTLPLGGWTVSAEADRVLIKKAEPVVFYCGISMRFRGPSQDEEAYYLDHGVKGQLCIALSVGPRLSFEEYGAWMRRRHERRENFKRLHESLSDIPFTKSYQPRNPEEEALVMRCERTSFELEVEARPVLFTEDSTIYLRGMRWNIGFENRECGIVFPPFTLWGARSVLRDLERELAPYVEGDAVHWYLRYGLPPLSTDLPYEVDLGQRDPSPAE